MTKSVLSAQASLTNEMSSCRFYQRLGFKRYILNDNGLSHTSDAFRNEVKRTPQLWVESSSNQMAFLQLKEAKIILRALGRDGSPSDYSKSQIFAKFPWCASSMMEVEEMIRKQPIITLFSGKGLYLTERPLTYFREPSILSGTVTKERFKLWCADEFLNTDEMQMILAIMLRDTSSSHYMHVVPPQMFQRMHDAIVLRTCPKDTAKELEEKGERPLKDQLKSCFDDFQYYVDSI